MSKFYCDRCGCCCRTVSKSEIYRPLDRGDGVCMYFDDATNLCKIYEHRPLLCRVDEAYSVYFVEMMSKEEYHKLNYQACKLLKQRFQTNL